MFVMTLGGSRQSAGVVIVRCVADRWHYLLLRSYRYWDFPKGAVEAGESPWMAACREVNEETGLTSLEFRWGEAYIETEPYAGGKVARYYVAISPSGAVSLGINAALGRPEHHEYRWLDYAAAGALLNPRVRRILDWARAMLGDSCQP